MECLESPHMSCFIVLSIPKEICDAPFVRLYFESPAAAKRAMKEGKD